MIARILAWFLIIFGIIFFIRPEILKRRFQKKSLKIVKKYLFVITIFVSLWFIAAALKMSGALSKVLLILGLIGIVKAFFFIKAKAADRILSWWLDKPTAFFRISALFYIGFGLILLFIK